MWKGESISCRFLYIYTIADQPVAGPTTGGPYPDEVVETYVEADRSKTDAPT